MCKLVNSQSCILRGLWLNAGRCDNPLRKNCGWPSASCRFGLCLATPKPVGAFGVVSAWALPCDNPYDKPVGGLWRNVVLGFALRHPAYLCMGSWSVPGGRALHVLGQVLIALFLFFCEPGVFAKAGPERIARNEVNIRSELTD